MENILNILRLYIILNISVLLMMMLIGLSMTSEFKFIWFFLPGFNIIMVLESLSNALFSSIKVRYQRIVLYLLLVLLVITIDSILIEIELFRYPILTCILLEVSLIAFILKYGDSTFEKVMCLFLVNTIILIPPVVLTIGYDYKRRKIENEQQGSNGIIRSK